MSTPKLFAPAAAVDSAKGTALPGRQRTPLQQARDIESGFRALERKLGARPSSRVAAELGRLGFALEPAVSIQGIRPFGWSRSYAVTEEYPSQPRELQRWVEAVSFNWNQSGKKLELRLQWSEVWSNMKSDGFERDSGWVPFDRLRPQLAANPSLMKALEQLIQRGVELAG